jgi:CRISPR-associated protein Csd1
MILQALMQYAEREGLGDPHFEKVTVRWLIPLNKAGRLSRKPIELVADPGAAKLRPIELMRPFTSQNELNQGDKSHFLCDTAERALAFPNPMAPRRSSAIKRQHEYFKRLLQEAATGVPKEEKMLKAVLKFLGTRTELQRLHVQLSHLNARFSDNVTFQVGSSSLLENEGLKTFWRQRRDSRLDAVLHPYSICLCTGKLSECVNTTEKVKGVPGCSSFGGNLISFDKPAFWSFGLRRAANAPLSFEAEPKIRHALHQLIQKGYRFGRSVLVCWPRQDVKADPFELVDGAEDSEIQKLLEAPRAGLPAGLGQNNHYYALSLSGNGSRIIVRDWLTTTVPQVERNLHQWFKDLSLVGSNGKAVRVEFKLLQLLYCLVRESLDELPSKIPTQVVFAALLGWGLPRSVLEAAIRRQKIESAESPSIPRMAMIKAYLLRNKLSSERKENQEMNERINLECRDPAYLCGRLFAVFARLQFYAVENVSAGVVERFFAGAIVSPAAVMGRLFRGSSFHLGKVGGGLAENFRKDLEAVAAALGNEFPRTLSLEGQGRFALGYYHQRAEYRRLWHERRDKLRSTETLAAEITTPVDTERAGVLYGKGN